MSLLPTSAFSASKTVESSGGNSFATVTQMRLTSYRAKSHSNGDPYHLIGQAETQCCNRMGQQPICSVGCSRSSHTRLVVQCIIVYALFVQQLIRVLFGGRLLILVGGSEPVCAIHASSTVLTS